MTVELGVFVDQPLYDHFKLMYNNVDQELERFIIASVNNVYYTGCIIRPF